MKKVALTLLAMLAVAQLMVGPSEGAINCNQVNGALASCVSYLTGGGRAPSSQCCAGVKNVNSMATNKADRIATCNCLKQASGRYKNIKDEAASNLPQKCNVQVNVPITRNTDCNTIS